MTATIYQDLEDCTDPDGLQQNQRFPHRGASNNGICYSGEAMCILARQKMVRHEDRVRWREAMAKCEVDGHAGLYRRGPEETDQQGPDDYKSLVAASALLHLDLAAAVLDYGLTTWVHLWGPFQIRFVYNNVLPGTLRHPDGRWNWSAWLGRDPAFIAHLYFCAGRLPPLWLRVCWALEVATAGIFKTRDQDSRRLTWMMILGMQDQSWLCRGAAWYWRQRFKREWPGGLPAVYEEYFNDREHLLFHTRWAPRV